MTLLEVVIAITILATVLVALGGLMASLAKHTRRSTASTYVTAAATSASAWAQGLPWDSLIAPLPCISDTIGVFTYDRCATLQDSTPKLKRIIMVISTTGPILAPPETVIVDRFRAMGQSPFGK